VVFYLPFQPNNPGSAPRHPTGCPCRYGLVFTGKNIVSPGNFPIFSPPFKSSKLCIVHFPLPRPHSGTGCRQKTSNPFDKNISNSHSGAMKKHIKALWLTLLVAAFGVAIGFLGELMPDGFKSKVEAFATRTVGISYTKVWLISAGLLVLLFLFIVWREAVQKEKPGNDPPSH
jgi:hypothetical protein